MQLHFLRIIYSRVSVIVAVYHWLHSDRFQLNSCLQASGPLVYTLSHRQHQIPTNLPITADVK